MKSFRVLLMLTALLAFANVVNAQSISAAALQAIRAAAQERSRDSVVIRAHEGTLILETQEQSLHANVLVLQGAKRCEASSESCWLMQALQQCVASCQRLRAMCCSDCTRSTQTALPGCAACPLTPQAAGCVAGGTCPVQTRAATAPAPCCCAKACACCESCKAAKGAAVPQAAPPMPYVQVMPCPPTYVLQVAHPVRPAKLVTPDLEAHCEKMTHKGDMIVLEGNVLLLCKKHAQPMRVEAQRVLVNMKDGSFSVESAGSMTMPAATSFGVMRSSLVEPASNGSKVMLSGFQFDNAPVDAYVAQWKLGHGSPMPNFPVREWVPVPSSSDRVIRVMPVPMLPPQELPRATPPR
jgi:lipopolysaccharide export system protein LptA